MQPMINTMLDPIVNFGKVTVSTGYDNVETSIVLNSGHGSKLPNPSTDGSFNLVWYDSSSYGSASDDPNVEIVRCIARTGDTLVIMRAQEGTLASNKNTSASTYKMILSPTKKTITDIKTEYESGVSTHAALSSSVHGFDASGNAPAQIHGSSKHSGTIGTEADITFSTTVGHAHTGSDSTIVDHINLNNKGTNTHSQIDTALTASAGHIAANGTSVHGLGTMSTQNANNVAITGGSISGITNLNVAGSLSLPFVTKTSGYTLTSSDYLCLCNASGGIFTITLPATSGIAGTIYQIKKIDSSANVVTVDGNAFETIDGALTYLITSQYDSITIMTDGTNWYII